MISTSGKYRFISYYLKLLFLSSFKSSNIIENFKKPAILTTLMLNGNQFICDLCAQPIEGEEVVEVCTVDHDCRNTGEKILYFHLSTDRSSKYYERCGENGCYHKWIDSAESFTPHGIRRVPKQEVQEKSTSLNKSYPHK
jgi:hypothetical protein